MLDADGNETIESMEQCISFEDDIMLGDINEDGILNILDIVTIIQLVLVDDFNPNADMNEDGILNILDIVTLIQVVLNS